jgi:hypothetical protein
VPVYSHCISTSPSSIAARAGAAPGMPLRSVTSNPRPAGPITAILPRISASVKFLVPTTTSAPVRAGDRLDLRRRGLRA